MHDWPSGGIDAVALAATVAELERKVSFLSDRQQIGDVYRRYARGFDRCDVELLRSSFWPDVQINYGSERLSFDGFVAKHLDGRERELHGCALHLASESVEIAGDTAHVECYVLALFRLEEGSTLAEGATVAAGRHIDRLDRRDGEWRIAVREFVPHFLAKTESVFDAVVTEEQWPRSDRGRGTWDRSDPSYLRPLDPRPGRLT